MKRLLPLCLWSWVSVLGACGGVTEPDEPPVCTTKRTFARPAQGGNCQYYESSCDIPSGSVQCCGGLAYGGCPESKKCVDDPEDACVPGQTSDCPGLCQ